MDLTGISSLSEAGFKRFRWAKWPHRGSIKGRAGSAGPRPDLGTIMHVMVGLWRAQVRSSKVTVSVIVQEGSDCK